MRLLALTSLLLAIALLARRRLDVVVVRGRSMAPTLLPGDRLLVVRTHHAPRTGDVVLAPDPLEPGRELVKRVAGVGPGRIELRGDNVAASTDARVAPDRVRWRAVIRYWPPNRATTRLGRLRSLEPIEEGGEAACAVPEALLAGPAAGS
jgi:signal peptidase I